MRYFIVLFTQAVESFKFMSPYLFHTVIRLMGVRNLDTDTAFMQKENHCRSASTFKYISILGDNWSNDDYLLFRQLK